MIDRYPTGWTKREHGCKVGWLTYPNRELAEQASKAAYDEAQRLLKACGWEDYGFQYPGDIRETADGFRVTTP